MEEEEEEEAALSKAAFSQAFHEVVSLVTGFCALAKLISSSSSTEESIPWEYICGPSSGRHPRIFLSLFDKTKFLSKEVHKKFRKAVDEKKKTSSALPCWGGAYRLGNLPDYHKALKLNESFSLLLDKPVASSRHVTLSIDDITKLEACVRELVEAQSYSLWSIATMFEFLTDLNCVPGYSVFRKLIASMTRAFTTQAKTTYLLQEFLQQTKRELYVSHLPGETPLAFDSFYFDFV